VLYSLCELINRWLKYSKLGFGIIDRKSRIIDD
jgi:hypothetical protein